MASDDETSHASDMEDEEEEEEEEENGLYGCKDMLMLGGPGSRRTRRSESGGRWFLGKVLNPRAKWVQEWNRVFLLVCAVGLFVDPLFFYALSISDTCMCLFVDGWFAITVTVLRCMTDALHVWNMWLQFKMAKLRHSSSSHHNNIAGEYDDGGVGQGDAEESLQNRSTTATAPARSTAFQYLKAKKGFFFDLFVILPLPQVMFP